MIRLTAILVLSAFAAEAEVDVRVILDPPVTPYHKQPRFTIQVEAPEGAGVKLPDMVDHFGGLAVYGTPEYRSESLRGNRIRITETYTLDAISVGDYVIAPVTVTWEGSQGVTVPSPLLRVRELTPEEEAAANEFVSDLPIPDLTERPIYARGWFWAAIMGTVIALALAAWWWPRKKVADAPVILKTPWEWAYDELRALDSKAYTESGAFEPFYVELSFILRRYIERKFLIHAPEQTTPEFLEEVRGSGVLSPEHQRLLAGFLKHCDRVKFAKYEPSRHEMETSFTTVLQFVDETKPSEPVAEEEAA